MIKNNRKTLLIDPQFQIRFILINLIIGLFTLLLIYITNLIFINKMRSFGLTANLHEKSPYFDLISIQAEYLNTVMLIAGVIISSIIIITGLVLSHKIAGPIYRIKLSLKNRINKINNDPFKIRKNDYFQELVDLLNQYENTKK